MRIMKKNNCHFYEILISFVIAFCFYGGNAQEIIQPCQLYQNNKHKWCAIGTDSPYCGMVYGNFSIHRQQDNNLGRLRELGLLFDNSINYYNKDYPDGFIRFGFTGDVIVVGHIQNGKEQGQWQVYYEDTVLIMNYSMNKGFIDSDLSFYDRSGRNIVCYRYFFTKWWHKIHRQRRSKSDKFYSKMFLRLPTRKDIENSCLLLSK